MIGAKCSEHIGLPQCKDNLREKTHQSTRLSGGRSKKSSKPFLELASGTYFLREGSPKPVAGLNRKLAAELLDMSHGAVEGAYSVIMDGCWERRPLLDLWLTTLEAMSCQDAPAAPRSEELML
jgi:hypothetical protein